MHSGGPSATQVTRRPTRPPSRQQHHPPLLRLSPNTPAGVHYRYTPSFHKARNLLLDPRYASRLSDEIRRMVHHEEPIHEDLALRRARELNGVGSA